MSRARLTIPTRIFVAISGVLIAFTIVSGESVRRHGEAASALRLLHEAYMPLRVRLADARAHESLLSNMLEYVLAERDTARTRRWLEIQRRVIPGVISEALTILDRAEALDAPDGDRRLLADVRHDLLDVQRLLTEMDSTFARLFEALDGPDRDAAIEVHASLVRRDGQLRRILLVAANRIGTRIDDTSRAAAENERSAVATLSVLFVLALIAGIFVSIWSARVLAPLPRLRERVLAVARGDLAPRVEAARDDEIGVLADEFEKMVEAVGARDQRLRELQRMQEQIVASLRAAVLVLDEGGRLRSSSRAAETVLGLPPSAIGHPLEESGLPERLSGLREAIESVATGAARAELAAATLDASGSPALARRLDVLVTPFGDAPPGAARRAVLVVADDVTEELATKARLIQSERLAAMGKMAAHVTHEVRNPLSSIGLNVELLAEDVGERSAETSKLLRAIQREVDRLAGITEEYLRLARLPAPRLEPENLGDVVTEVAHFVGREMEASATRLSVDVAPDLPPVHADEAQVRQALLNLVRNAREATEQGGHIELGARAAEDGVVITVRDDGPGIATEQRERIFDLFFSTKERGTGLGLSLTQQIVLAHDGRIRCDDAPGGGTLFSLWFPAADGRAATGASDDSSRG